MTTRRRPDQKFSEQPTVPMTPVLLAALERLAREDQITRSELMRRLLQDGVNRRMGERSDQPTVAA